MQGHEFPLEQAALGNRQQKPTSIADCRPPIATAHACCPPHKLIPAFTAAHILTRPLPHESLRGAAGAATGSPWPDGTDASREVQLYIAVRAL